LTTQRVPPPADGMPPRQSPRLRPLPAQPNESAALETRQWSAPPPAPTGAASRAAVPVGRNGPYRHHGQPAPPLPAGPPPAGMHPRPAAPPGRPATPPHPRSSAPPAPAPPARPGPRPAPVPLPSSRPAGPDAPDHQSAPMMPAEATTTPIAVHATPRSAESTGTQPSQRSPSQRVDGRVAATIIAAGVGCAAFGIAVVLAESVGTVKQLLTLSTAVGPLSGKAVVAVVIYPVVWLVLHAALRNSHRRRRGPKVPTGSGSCSDSATYTDHRRPVWSTRRSRMAEDADPRDLDLDEVAGPEMPLGSRNAPTPPGCRWR
jgi:hypothetical protein